MTHNQSVGRWGEQAAEDYLCERGYAATGRNVRTPYGEIDLVMSKDDITVFVEVKSRMSRTFGPPEVAVTKRKQEHMQACAEYYAQQHNIDHWQIDVIAVERVGSKTEIFHIENAIS
jgi:putative endonuclease